MVASNRVVVTGMGVVAPNGIGLDAFWDSLIHCKSGIGPITLFDTSDFDIKIAGEVSGFNLCDYLGRSCKPHRLARQTQLALVACQMAIDQAGLTKEALRRIEPLNVILGVSSSAIEIITKAKEILMTRGPSRIRPYMIGACQPHAIGATLSEYLGVRASVSTLSTACPSGLDAVSVAANVVRRGSADLLVVGGADSPLNAPSVASFSVTGALSTSTDFLPEEVSRPFDLRRSGVVLGEGAGFLVLEQLESALARGATPLMEIIGEASIMDAPGCDSLEGLYGTMDMALKNAGICADQVDYVCANALSHSRLDKVEVEQIKRLFGKGAYQVPVSSIRGVMGHQLAASGIFQMVTCALSMMHDVIAPTANLTNPDPECDLDHVPLEARNAKVNIAFVNVHGQGGENSTVVMKKVQ